MNLNGTTVLDHVVRDVRYAGRSFRRAPLVAVTRIVTTNALLLRAVARGGLCGEIGEPRLAPRAKRAAVPPDDPLLNLDEFAVDGRGGRMTNEDIDRILYGGP